MKCIDAYRLLGSAKVAKTTHYSALLSLRFIVCEGRVQGCHDLQRGTEGGWEEGRGIW